MRVAYGSKAVKAGRHLDGEAGWNLPAPFLGRCVPGMPSSPLGLRDILGCTAPAAIAVKRCEMRGMP